MKKTIETSAQKEINPKNLVTIKDLQKEWNITRRTIYYWLSKGMISRVQYLGTSFIDKSTFKPNMTQDVINGIIAKYKEENQIS